MADVEILIADWRIGAMPPQTALSSLFPYTAAALPLCPENYQKLALRLAARDFCRDTELWRDTMTGHTVVDTATYDFTSQLDSTVQCYRVLNVSIDDITIAPRPYDEQGRDVDSTGYTVDTGGIITLYPAPTTADLDIIINVAVLPLLTCDEYPAWLMGQWGEVIVLRAVASLKAESKKPWSDPEGAQLKESDYRYRAGQAKGWNSARRSNANLPVVARHFT